MIHADSSKTKRWRCEQRSPNDTAPIQPALRQNHRNGKWKTDTHMDLHVMGDGDNDPAPESSVRAFGSNTSSQENGEDYVQTFLRLSGMRQQQMLLRIWNMQKSFIKIRRRIAVASVFSHQIKPALSPKEGEIPSISLFLISILQSLHNISYQTLFIYFK